jgi:hypothetical protein
MKYFAQSLLRLKDQKSGLLFKRNIWEKITTISTAISALASVCILCVGWCALQYTKQQIVDFRNESQAQHLIEKTKDFDSLPFKLIRKKLAQKRLNKYYTNLNKLNVNDAPSEMYDELNFCNDLGLLTENGALKAYDVWANFSYWVFPLYADSKIVIINEQKKYPAIWANCTYLEKKLEQIETKEDNMKQAIQTSDDIIDFYNSEM